MVSILNDETNPIQLTLIDTPGQEIFFRMRNYGAEIADFAILVISAEEGVGLAFLF